MNRHDNDKNMQVSKCEIHYAYFSFICFSEPPPHNYCSIVPDVQNEASCEVAIEPHRVLCYLHERVRAVHLIGMLTYSNLLCPQEGLEKEAQ